jgi:hypothetical protein
MIGSHLPISACSHRAALSGVLSARTHLHGQVLQPLLHRLVREHTVYGGVDLAHHRLRRACWH